MTSREPPLTLADLKSCARNYRWLKSSIRPLLEAFEDDDQPIEPLLELVDAWVSGGRKDSRAVRLAEDPVLSRLRSLFGDDEALGEVRTYVKRRSTAVVARRFLLKVLGGVDGEVSSAVAFPLTTLLRCIHPDRHCILATPHDIVSAITPVEFHADRIRRQQHVRRGARGLETWDSVADFVEDYNAYSAWLRSVAPHHGFDTPGEVDDGCWQLSRCLAGAFDCPGARGRGALCETGQRALRDEDVREVARRARRAVEAGAPWAVEAKAARFELFRHLLASTEELERGLSLDWEDAIRFLMPDPRIVEVLFADYTRRPKGSRGGKMLGWMETYFGHYIVQTLRSRYGSSTSELSKRLDTHGTSVKRRFKPDPLPPRTIQKAKRKGKG